MKKFYFLMLILPALLLSGCTTNNNNPTVEERPFENVTLEEATAFFNDVIFEETNLRQFFKDKILLDYSELDQLNYSDFQTGDIELVDAETNSYEISFYHKYSNYELSMNLFLDREDDLILIYKVEITESTYNYMQERFMTMHEDNIIKYITDDEKALDEICDRFDITNILCTDFINVIQLYDYQLSVSNSLYKDTYIISAFILENDLYEQNHFTTEIQIGINDEGSFIYDLSYFQEYVHDQNNVESFNKYDSYIIDALNLLNEGSISYNDFCAEYFYGEVDCLEGLTELDTSKPKTLVSRFLSAEEDYYKLFVDYSAFVSFSRNVIYYRIYETDNGNIFMHPVNIIYPSNDSTDDVSYYSDYFYDTFSSFNDDNFCELYDFMFADCTSIKNDVTSNNLTFKMEYIEKVNDELYVEYTLINPETYDMTYYTASYNLKSVIGVLSLIDSIKTESATAYYGTQQVKDIFTNYLKDLQNPLITQVEIELKYDTDMNVYFGALRDELIDEDIDVYLEDWTFSFNIETYEIDVVYPSQDVKNFELKLKIHSLNDRYIFAPNTYSSPQTYIPMEDRKVKAINTILNKDISDDVACSYSPSGEYKDICENLRFILQQENTDVYFEEAEMFNNRIQIVLYDTTTLETLKMYNLYITSHEIFTDELMYTFLLIHPEITSEGYQQLFFTVYQQIDHIPFTRSNNEVTISICDSMISDENCSKLEDLVLDNNILNFRALSYHYYNEKGDFFAIYRVEQYGTPDTVINQIIISTESYVINNEIIVRYKYIENTEEWLDEFYEDN